MANITAKSVMKLRTKTGCGMMECKNALVEAKGEFETAIKILREKGLSVAAKKADRIASEGIVDILISDGMTAMIEVNSETDFVAKNASFIDFVKDILQTIIQSKPQDIDALLATNLIGSDMTVDAALKDKIFTIGENMSIRRFELVDGVTGTYIHGNGTAGVITKFELEDIDSDSEVFGEYAKNICMQIAAMNPIYVSAADVPDSIIDAEKAVLIGQIENDDNLKSKPDSVKEKMVEGRIKKYFSDACLNDQQYVKDDSVTVAQYTQATAKELGGKINVVSFVKYERGEGLEKREEDFAAEIEKLVKG